MARYVAKNIVAAGLAEECEVQLAYAIGIARPVSVFVDTFGTGKVPDTKISEIVEKNFPLTPLGIIRHLDLLKPIFRPSARHGHFGRKPGKVEVKTGDKNASYSSFTWEKTDKAADLAKAAGH